MHLRRSLAGEGCTRARSVAQWDTSEVVVFGSRASLLLRRRITKGVVVGPLCRVDLRRRPVHQSWLPQQQQLPQCSALVCPETQHSLQARQAQRRTINQPLPPHRVHQTRKMRRQRCDRRNPTKTETTTRAHFSLMPLGVTCPLARSAMKHATTTKHARLFARFPDRSSSDSSMT
jgi:hypothetical protein